jgi:hypothetical protein
MDKTTRHQHWADILEEQADSGLSKKAFCAERGINVATFYYWQRRLGELSAAAESPGFRQVLPVREHELSLRLAEGEVMIRSTSVAALGRVLQVIAHA